MSQVHAKLTAINQASEAIRFAQELGSKLARTKAYRLRGGTHQETIGEDDNGRRVLVTYHDGETVESYRDLSEVFKDKFEALSEEAISSSQRKILCIYEFEIKQFRQILLQSISVVESPPPGFDEVAAILREIGNLAYEMLARSRSNWEFNYYADYGYRLSELAQNGHKAVESINPFDSKSATSSHGETTTSIRKKKSTASGDAQSKILGALEKHHQGGDTPNSAPIGVSELARMADVSKSTASEFFKRFAGGHHEYQRLCREGAIEKFLVRKSDIEPMRQISEDFEIPDSE
ncbi:hypothetical protein DTL42_11730 [Bremerella cremea]|uniref:Uncharacterized protein n=1 Tax=Bremerella cremea TaxID=1031537 RepID=A0A368KQT0_9BACT|nr:hypothetical protein [Bremerella cremea]RCS49203.1 hypothetical protein DTL42_11730 [Bremerella cremea]